MTKVDLTDEEEIEDAVVENLEEGGWERQKENKKHGVDIRMWHNEWRKYWFIEVKRKYSDRSNTYKYTAMAIAQVIYRMNQKKAGRYGIAVPNTKLFKNELLKIPLWIKEKLKIYIFLVDENGEITRITPAEEIE